MIISPLERDEAAAGINHRGADLDVDLLRLGDGALNHAVGFFQCDAHRGSPGWGKERVRLPRRDHTEALRLNPECRVELAAEVFERDRRGQFNDLPFAVKLLDAGEQRVVDLDPKST